MFGHGESTVVIPFVVLVPFNRAEVLAEPVCKPTTSLSDVHCLTTAACDGVNDSGCSAGVVSFRLHNSVRVVNVLSSSSECTCPASRSLTGKGPGLLLLRVHGEGAVNQDVLKVSIPPVNAHGRGREDVLCSRVVGQDTKVLK